MADPIPTPEQREEASLLAVGKTQADEIALALARAVAEEREACAWVAEAHGTLHDKEEGNDCHEHIASAIRARSGAR